MDLGKLTGIAKKRACRVCGARFEANERQTVLEQFADHSTIHNPTPEKWANAHELIQAGKQGTEAFEAKRLSQSQ
jgi:hypothetical protein